jgi:integrase
MRGHIRERSPGKRAIVFGIRDAAMRRSSSIDGLSCQIEGHASGWHRRPVAHFRHRLLKQALSHAVRWLCGMRRLTRYHSVKGTRREAEIEAATLVAAAAKGQDLEPSKITLSEFLDRWQRDWVAGNVSTKTAETYSHHLKHVRRHLGATRLQKLRPVNFAELYARLLHDGGRCRGLSPRRVGHIHRVTHRVLGHAVRWGLLQSNPVDLVDPPRVPVNEVEILRPEQAKAMLNELRGRPMYPIAALALATGMRRGELLALRWGDLDLDHGKVRVERSVEQTVRVGIVIKSPKTKHGRRIISLPASTVAELRAHWRIQQEHRLVLGIGKSTPDDLVFPAADGGPRSPNALSQIWLRAMRNLGQTATFHSLRHTHASHLIASGLDVVTISRRLGHGSPVITLGGYGHLFPNTDDRAAEIMEAAFTNASNDPKL